MWLFIARIVADPHIQVTEDQVIIDMKKKRHLPAILTAMDRFQNTPVSWMRNKSVVFRGASRT
jgi:hypothetical protein